MLSMKYLVFKEKLEKKLVDQYVSPYIIDKVVSTNAVVATTHHSRTNDLTMSKALSRAIK